MTSSQIFQKIFKLQGIALDPDEIESALRKVIEKLSHYSSADGINTFHGFISYRVKTDREFAEKFYYALKAAGFNLFLDCKCLTMVRIGKLVF